METNIQEVKFCDYEEEIISLRKKVWNYSEKYVAEKYFKNKFVDRFEDHSLHWIIKLNDRVIASCRLSIHYDTKSIPDHKYIEKQILDRLLIPVGSLNRLVIDPEWHGQGFGKLLDQVRFDKCKSLHCRSIIGITHGRRCHQLMNYGFTRLTFLKDFTDINTVSGEEMPSLFYKIIE